MTVITERPLADRVRLLVQRPSDTPFVVGTSWLGGPSPLGAPGSTSSWTEISYRATRITLNRGAQRDGLTPRNRVGMLTVVVRVEAYGLALTPADSPFLRDQPIRLLVNVAPNGQPAEWVPRFTGRVRDVSQEQVIMPSGPPTFFLTVTAVDAVAVLDEITRYGAMPESGGERFSARITRLAQSTSERVEIPNDYDFDVVIGGPAELGRTVYESSLSNHFTLAASTVAGWWWVDAEGVTRFAPLKFDPTGPAVFTDRNTDATGTPWPVGTLHYLDEIPDSGTSAQINGVIFRVKGAEPDPDDPTQWVAVETDVRANWGGQSLEEIGFRPAIVETVALNGWSEPPFSPAAFAYSAGWATMLSGITWNVQEDFTRLPELDVGKSVKLTRAGVTYTYAQSEYLVIGVEDTITPTRWITRLIMMGA